MVMEKRMNKISKILNISKLEEQLKESENYLSIALKGTASGSWSWDLESNKIILSKELLEMLGFDKVEIILKQKQFLENIHPDDTASFMYEIVKHKKGNIDSVNVDIRMKSAFKSWNWVNIKCKVTEYDENGTPIRIDGLNFDINEQKQYDEEVQHLQDELIISSHERRQQEEADRLYSDQVNNHLDWYTQFRRNGLNGLVKN